MNKINPYIIDLQKKYFYPKTLSLDRMPDRWAVDYKVIIGDKDTAQKYKKSNLLGKLRYRFSGVASTDGKIGYEFFFTVCSPAYKNNPETGLHSSQDLSKALVQEQLSEADVSSFLYKKVESIGRVDWSTLHDQLKAFLDTTDWNEDLLARN